ncbi:MAG: tetratricopeptide repeat protein [Bacteroidetes bacterium]|nr:tetratricopeptide repeat protein [Bacteroidota bacterium]
MKKESKKTDQTKFSWIILGLILVMTVILYGRSTRYGFMEGWDDLEYIENKEVQKADISRIFSGFQLGMYQPLSVLSLSLNYSTAGTNAAPYHTANLFLHLINIILVFVFINHLSRNKSLGVICALLFAIHPMNVEAVAWISARSTLLFTGLSLGSLICYLKYKEHNRKWVWASIAVLLFILALLAKSLAITLPLVFLLNDWYRKGKIKLWDGLEKIPLLAISVIFGIITIRASESFGHITPIETQFTLTERVILNVHTIILYLFKALFPVNLSAIYAFPLKTTGHLGSLYYLSLIPAAGLIFLFFWKNRFRKEIIYGILFFLLSISIVLPLFWSRKFMAGERYAYFSFIGIFFIIAHLYNYLVSGKLSIPDNVKRVIWSGAAVYIIFLAATTFQRITVWSGTEKLMQDVIRKERTGPASAQAHYYKGSFDFDRQNYRSALESFSKAIELHPGFAEAYNDRGILKGMAGKYQEALNDFNQAVNNDPENPESYYNRGFALYQLGMKTEACNDWHHAQKLNFKPAINALIKYCEQQ